MRLSISGACNTERTAPPSAHRFEIQCPLCQVFTHCGSEILRLRFDDKPLCEVEEHYLRSLFAGDEVTHDDVHSVELVALGKRQHEIAYALFRLCFEHTRPAQTYGVRALSLQHGEPVPDAVDGVEVVRESLFDVGIRDGNALGAVVRRIQHGVGVHRGGFGATEDVVPAVVVGFALFYLLNLPFDFNQIKEGSAFACVVKYWDMTAKNLRYSLNAFNFQTLLGNNFGIVSTESLIVSVIFIAFMLALVAIGYFKTKNRMNLLLLATAFITFKINVLFCIYQA